MRISDWSSDVCSSDLGRRQPAGRVPGAVGDRAVRAAVRGAGAVVVRPVRAAAAGGAAVEAGPVQRSPARRFAGRGGGDGRAVGRSEEHTSELQSLMRSSYAVFCLKKQNI